VRSQYIKSYILEFLDEVKSDFVKPRRSRQAGKFEKLVADLDLHRNSHVGWNREIIELFEKTGQDYRDPDSWFALVGFIASALLHRGKSGSPRKLKRPSKDVLKRDFVSCLKANPRLKGQHLVEEMTKKFPKKYGPIEPSTLLRWISDEKISIVKERRKVRAAAKAKKIRRNSKPTCA
jgi:hypothetical protein